jgi:hypothetical protein
MFTFVQRDPDSLWVVVGATRTPSGWQTRPIMSLPRGAEYVVWPKKDVALTATGTTVYIRPGAKAPWIEAGDLRSAGLRSISRLAVSPDGKWLAFVAEPR